MSWIGVQLELRQVRGRLTVAGCCMLRVIVSRSVVVLLLVSPPVARKKRPSVAPASMFKTGFASAVNRALSSVNHSPFAGFTQPLPKVAWNHLLNLSLGKTVATSPNDRAMLPPHAGREREAR